MPNFIFSFFFVRRTRTTVPVLPTSLSRRVAARIFAFLSHYSRIRRVAALSVIAFNFYVFAEQFASHFRRFATL